MEKSLKRTVQTLWYGRLFMSVGILGVIVFSALQLRTVLKHIPNQQLWVLELSQSAKSLENKDSSKEKKKLELSKISKIAQSNKLYITQSFLLIQSWEQKLESSQQKAKRLKQELFNLRDLKQALEQEKALALDYQLGLEQQRTINQSRVLSTEGLVQKIEASAEQENLKNELQKARDLKKNLTVYPSIPPNLLERATLENRIIRLEQKLALANQKLALTNKDLQASFQEEILRDRLAIANALESGRQRERERELAMQHHLSIQLTEILKRRLRPQLEQALKDTQVLSNVLKSTDVYSHSLEKQRELLRLLELELTQALSLANQPEYKGISKLLQTLDRTQKVTRQLSDKELFVSILNMELERSYELALYRQDDLEGLLLSETNRVRTWMQSVILLGASLVVLLSFLILITRFQSASNLPLAVQLSLFLPEEYIAEWKYLQGRYKKQQKLSSWTIQKRLIDEFVFMLWTYYTQTLIENLFLPSKDHTIDD
ncbi:MAG: hypothetical protein F6K11_09435 [Leptolyngbya sp. SIO3F4]|nr:hypothetical protein [Leptolyngbya sp. SIO3F4]